MVVFFIDNMNIYKKKTTSGWVTNQQDIEHTHKARDIEREIERDTPEINSDKRKQPHWTRDKNLERIHEIGCVLLFFLV